LINSLNWSNYQLHFAEDDIFLVGLFVDVSNTSEFKMLYQQVKVKPFSFCGFSSFSREEHISAFT
jgi:hypothetical protein